MIHFPKTKAVLSCRMHDGMLREITVTPYHGNFLVCICYDKKETVPGCCGSHTAAVDFGIDNLMAVTTDTGESVLFKGGALKAENQWFNKRRAELVRIITKGHKDIRHPVSRQLESLSLHRSEWMHDTFHKMSSRLIEWCETNNVGVLVLGVNTGWKQKVRMGNINNQKFVYIPFHSLQQMIRYKARRAGIEVRVQEESYTSRASFLDKDHIPVYGEKTGPAVFSGRRIHRGLYQSKDGILINADLNGAANILRKYGADTEKVSVKGLQEPHVIHQSDLNTCISRKGIEAA